MVTISNIFKHKTLPSVTPRWFGVALFFLLTLPSGAAERIHISGEVYGGGHQGQVQGNTYVNVQSGEIGQDKWVGTPNGGVFGGGEGENAIVTGNTTVKIEGGVIRNSIYGGGKMGNVLENTFVEVTGGTIHVSVYAGARMADVSGYTYAYVHGNSVLGALYGGNDIAGEVKNALREAPTFYASVPAEYKPSVVPTTFLQISRDDNTTQPFIGAAYGGSDGGYTYVNKEGRYDVTLPNDNTDPTKGTTVVNVSTPPVLDRTFLDFAGGTVGNMFAGGDNVTVTDAADIYLHADQTLTPASIPLSYVQGKDAFIKEFDAEPNSYTVSGTDPNQTANFKYQLNRVFGGNNVAHMNIRPNWHLISSHVNNLYAGGNRGDMTYANGIYITVEGAGMTVHNVFGGCRLSDVHPTEASIAAETIDGFDFPAGYAARVLIKGGKIYNVYGGNDVSGQVYNGANVVIRSSIIENVYGSGNGSYAYYSNVDHEGSDYYFKIYNLKGVDALKALNTHRPNTENVLVDLAGTESKTTFIAGNVFCGGNSATLRDLTGKLESAQAKIKLGSYVTVNGVFLGSNGDQMLQEDVIVGMNDPKYNTAIDLTQHDQMVEYMNGVEVAIQPTVEFAGDYVPYSSYIGSFFCGGNKGSMSATGTFIIDFLRSVRIFDKLVAGSNDANVQEKTDGKLADGTTNNYVNHSYVLGGLTSAADPKVRLNISGVQTEPRRITYDAEAGTFSFDWNRYRGTPDEGDMKDYKTYLHGGNIYGGCYNSGYVNGGVEINITDDIVTEELLTEMKREIKADGTYTGKTGVIHDYDWDHHVFEPFISLLTCYGGGYGTETEIWGNTTINVTNQGHLMKIRGGGEKGWIGKMKRDPEHGTLIEDAGNEFKSYYYNDSTKFFPIKKYQVEQAYDATVHLDANLRKDASTDSILNNVSEMTAGGFAGIVTGNTHALVDNGCVYTVFGGASNAHIYGSAETIIGKNGFPYVTQTVYGGNDFGGQIMGSKVYATNNENDGSLQTIKCNTYVEYNQGEIGYGTGETTKPDSMTADFGIFGGGYGFYDYRTKEGNKYYGKASSQPNLLSKITIDLVGGKPEADFAANCFVNISSKTTKSADKVMRIYGGGQGYPGQMGVACTRQTYVLFAAANAAARNTYLAQYVFGAGDCARTWYSRLDAYSGNARYLFGANRGISYMQSVDELVKSSMGEVKAQFKGTDSSTTPAGMIQDLTYMGESSLLNVYPSLEAPSMDVFASGAFSGTKRTVLNLYGGRIRNAYGASIEEGITYLTEVNVPKGSTVRCNAIYGGGKGLYRARPCDTYITSVNFHSLDAVVEEAIYGGNDSCRFTRRTTIDIDVPVKNSLGKLVDVYGGGRGANTISEITFITLEDGAQVKNVFGGGCEGLVYNKPSVIQYMLTEDYYKDKYTDGDYYHSYYLGDIETQGFNTWKNQEGIKDISLYAKSTTPMTIGTLAPLSMGYAAEVYNNNTEILIHQGALVTENAFGAGYGQSATTAGGTLVKLLGGTVQGNIYGGGNSGNVKDTLKIAGKTLANGVGPIEMNNRTEVYLNGGTCTNSYGSGFKGSVYGDAFTYVGRDSCKNDAVRTFIDGDPAITRSLYGGGEQGAVSGTAYINYYYGHVGYKYDTNTKKYIENVNYQENVADSILYQNGNVFGGGYGEDAITIKTNVNLWGGIIRNSLYGGGEISAIGKGEVDKTSSEPVPPLKSITIPGETHVYMYGGHVLRDVFGGGRGYSYNLLGREVTGDKFYTDGYVFGKTDVNIYCGEIGSGDEKSLNLGYGNVFGGGNVGFVYSAEGKKYTGESTATKTQGYYYIGDTDNLSEDCRVVVSPYCKVTADGGVTIDGTPYDQCAYVPTNKLDHLLGKVLDDMGGTTEPDKATWDKLDYLTGITIHNAVFAGGNVARGDSKLYADTKTVYGNAVAVLNDIYHRDLITIGTEHVGGIYGEGNLTKVDGYREICIANYGTDYYGLKQEITEEEYYQLTDRERAYFQLMYKCVKSYDKYVVGTTITQEVFKLLPPEEQVNWQLAGFCTVYAGRLLNTIQRADFVGVHGSRLVLQGAQDRTVSVVDYMDYAINRVKEVSLNQRNSVTGETGDEASHGNYFGMYSVVNYLAALTSDVNMSDTRKTESAQHPVEPAYPTYYAYKDHYKEMPYRNNGTSPNMIALASGVYLELTTEESTDSTKVYGPITGVIQLELINLGDDMGGAFVYAKNIHGTRSGEMLEQAVLSSYNVDPVTGKKARTNRGYTYDNTPNLIETSGNFVHSTKQIVDDCYPGAGDISAVAHYWYLRGSVYVYDQYISAYTGSSTAYKADVQIPLTITAGSHGQLKVIAIQPNLYAYYKNYTSETSNTKLGDDEKMVVNGVTYHLNDVITYWDWSNLSPMQKKLFVHDTYICTHEFSYEKGGSTINVPKGFVMLESEYKALPEDVTIINENAEEETVSKSETVHVSNGTKHSTGYALTADVSNPGEWDDRYIEIERSSAEPIIITKEEYNALSDAEKAKYIAGPSYHAQDGVYGQMWYGQTDIISAEIVGAYERISAAGKATLQDPQAKVEAAYVSTAAVTYNYGGSERSLQKGVGVCETEYKEAIKQVGENKFDKAYVCNATVSIGEDYVITGDLISEARYKTLSTENKTKFSSAFLCTTAGWYGGTEYESKKNYDALKAWCDLAKGDREKFTFNYDAFDLFWKDLDPNAAIADYDKPGTDYYSRGLPIEYAAICLRDTSFVNKEGKTVSYHANDTLKSDVFETTIPNEKLHYSNFKMSEGGNPVYIVKKEFVVGNTSYSVGNTITAQTYEAFEAEQKANIAVITGLEPGSYYYCRDAYEVNEAGMGHPVTNVFGTTKTYNKGENVPTGVIIAKTDYDLLPNYQLVFRVTGVSPIETSTLYVARDASMNDVLKDRVITVIYKYEYEESNTDGSQVNLISERHILNIHLLFRSGSPSVGRLQVPGAVLPGTTVGLKQPSVTQGAYEILGGGWEVYDTESDAVNHINGQPYINNSSLVYFYQNGRYVAYYAKTYLGKTYSNPVPFTVANYHSINDVMADTEHYMYIDHPGVPRNCKVYIDNDAFKNDTTKSELDLLRDLYDLSVKENSPLNEYIKGCNKLDFILQEDIKPKKYTDWTPLGTDENCFGNGGYVHGDGHAITGLSASLFGTVCANIFNLGVKGSFTGAGVANKADYVANCWVWNEKADGHTGRPIIGNELADADAGVLVNSYYLEEADATDKYTESDNAIRKPEASFVNGEVAYDLNKYYLVKRYTDQLAEQPSIKYSYYTINPANNKVVLHKDEKGYTAEDAFITVTYLDDDDKEVTKKLGYAEFRFWDGDFVNADAQLHTLVDERYHEGEYYPIYPDDYIFFGQHLTYGYVDDYPHGIYPTAITRSEDNRLLLKNEATNRVFRAPAYMGTMDKQVAHFNANCVVPDFYLKEIKSTTTVDVKQNAGVSGTGSVENKEEKTLPDGTVLKITTIVTDDAATDTRTTTVKTVTCQPTDAYPHMTAIDFTGYNDYAYASGIDANKVFYSPVLDYNTLIGFNNPEQSRNMLVYANSTSDEQGYKVLNKFLIEPALTFTSDNYKNIPRITEGGISSVKGHLVDLISGTYKTDRNHFLVDENDFHCPIAYNMGADKRMWYQRTPCTFVDGTNDGATGYESIVLPFNAEIVSAHQKGEITHFYNNDKANHEYWLRGFKGVEASGKLKFIRPMSGSSDEGYDERYKVMTGTYNVENSFLYDYYYSNSLGKDKNQDIYQTYYNEQRNYSNYVQLTANVPYIMAFPGKMYYEFDMSGQFIPKNTFAAIGQLDKQNVSFCSATGAFIDVLQAEDLKTTHDGYVFEGIFQQRDMTVASEANARILNTKGDKFVERTHIYLDQPDQELKVMQPFHAYLKPTSGGVKEFTIGEDATYVNENENENENELLRITVENRVIHIESYMNEETIVRVVNTAGQLMAIRKLAPEAKVSIPVRLPGVYMVNNRKIHVK